MKLFGLSALSAAALVGMLATSPVVAGAKEKTPKTAKECAKHAKHGWKWEAGKCVKGEAPAKAAAEAKKAKPAATTPATEPAADATVEDEGALEE